MTPKNAFRQANTGHTAQALLHASGLAVVYVLLVFLLPASHQALRTYHLNSLEYHILLFTVALPSLAVWFAAFYSYAKLRTYAAAIPRAAEHGDFIRLAKGCQWLAWSLPLPTIIGLVVDAITDAHAGFRPAAAIITNYVSLLLPLVGFSMIGTASRSLTGRARIQLNTTSIRNIVLGFVTVGVLYCYLVFQQLGSVSFGSTANPYYLPLWLMITTVTIPYLYAWFVGLLGAYEISAYSRNVRGLLYKQSLWLLASGLTVVIISSVALQYINSVAPRAGYLLLNYHLLLVSCCRIIGGVGYSLIAFGAIRLKKIEEV